MLEVSLCIEMILNSLEVIWCILNYDLEAIRLILLIMLIHGLIKFLSKSSLLIWRKNKYLRYL